MMIQTTTPPIQRRLARLITEVFAPSPLAVVAITVVAIHASHSAGDALKWAVLGSIFAPLLPLLHLVRKVRRGEVTDIHVRERTQRPPIILAFLVSGIAAFVVLGKLGAPREMLALIGSAVVACTVALTITMWWKISIHVGVVAGIITVFVLLFGPVALLLVPLVPLVAWARVAVGDHTPLQTIVGALIGAGTSGLAFALVMTLLG